MIENDFTIYKGELFDFFESRFIRDAKNTLTSEQYFSNYRIAVERGFAIRLDENIEKIQKNGSLYQMLTFKREKILQKIVWILVGDES